MSTRAVIDPLCEKCGGHTWVVGTAFDEITHQIVRRRECRKCSHRFYTVQQQEAYLSPGQRVEYIVRGQRLVRVVEKVAADEGLIMTELSPAAQAVLDAYDNSSFDEDCGDRVAIAAALEAAADQVVPDEPAPTGMRPAGDVYSAREIRRGQRQGTRSQLLAIAAELQTGL